MKILIIGQCTLHWGRMEFGNIGNYYIIEPFIRLLHQTFPSSRIRTTFQMSERFCEKEKVEILPMDLFYGWKDNDLAIAEKELEAAYEYLNSGTIKFKTPYIEEVLDTDIVIDFSGDIWGDNADFLGPERFYIGLCKDRVAQIFAKKTVMLAGSPGPFENSNNLEFAKEVFENFDLVTNRESISKEVLKQFNFNTEKTYSLSCPSFNFVPADTSDIIHFDHIPEIINSDKPNVGFLICGWNFLDGPFDKWPRPDSDYILFVEAIEQFTAKIDANIYLMSHSNGFEIPPAEFELLHGRDFPIIKQLQKILQDRGKAKNIFILDEVYDAWQTKAILGLFEMVVSGRVHAAVGALSQLVPTVVIDYGHEPKAHKLKGFSHLAGVEKYLADPEVYNDLFSKMSECWENRSEIEQELKKRIPEVKAMGVQNFLLLKQL